MSIPEILIAFISLITVCLLIIAFIDYNLMASYKMPLFWRINPKSNWKFDSFIFKKTFTNLPRIIIITGGNEGIGKETAIQLARTNAHVIIASRNKTRSYEAIHEIIDKSGNSNIHYFYLDISSFESIKNFVEEIKKIIISKPEDIDSYQSNKEENLKLPLYALINNAGVMMLPSKVLSKDGIEMTFAVNYFGPFLLTNLLLPMLKFGSQALKVPTRIINVSSRAHVIGPTRVKLDNLKSEKHFDRHMVYGNSKLALVMFTRELARRLDKERELKSVDDVDVRCFSLHPGTISTNLFKHVPSLVRLVVTKFFSVSIKEGAMTSLYCTLDDKPLKDVNGSYYSECSLVRESSKAHDINFNRKLWEITEDVCYKYLKN